MNEHRRKRQLLLSALLPLLLVLGLLGAPVHAAEPREVWVLTIHGVIGPLATRYLERGLQDAAAEGAEAVVLRLDTPGGLGSSMRDMTRLILNAPVPVVIYVTPPGAQAASAGMFLVLAGHVAAMAPGTNIGAASPVQLQGEKDPVALAKAMNDAAALARAIAEERGRNASWAEQAVREGVSITATEAQKQGVIDLVARDLNELLARVDGRPVTIAGRERPLQTKGAPVTEHPMNLAERILLALTNPNIAYLLLTIGMIGLIAELYNPGALFPGITGLLSLLLAFVALGSLPINWAGIILLLLAAGLFVAELSAEGIGVLAVGGLVAFVLGSLMLFRPTTIPAVAGGPPDLQVSPWLIATMTAGIAGFFLIVMRAVLRAAHAPIATGVHALVGKTGVALSDLSPRGRVRVDSEVWSAVTADELITAGQTVRVLGIDGVMLRVTRTPTAADRVSEELKNDT